jgi:tetratricopeptide (TPR) repeat protein
MLDCQLQVECERQLKLEKPKPKAERKKLQRRTIFGSSSSSCSTCSPSNKEIPVPSLVPRVARNAIKQSDDTCVHEVIAFAQALKEKAEKEFASKNYDSALLTSTNAIDAAQDVKNKAGSIIMQLAAVTIMTACSIRAATCCLKLDRCDEAEEIAGKALVMIGNALEPKLDGRTNTCTRVSETGDGYPRNFGGWRVNSFLVLARVSIEQQDYEQALQVLDNAHGVTAKYTASEYAQQTLPKASTGCLLSSEEENNISVSLGKEPQESERREERQVTQESLGSSPCVSIDDEETDEDPQPVSVELICAVKRIASPISGESVPKRMKKEELALDVLDSSPRATDVEDGVEEDVEEDDEDDVEEHDDDDDEKKEHGDQQEISQVLGSVVKVPGVPPKAPDVKSPVQVSDQQLIFSVLKSAMETAHNSLMADCPSLCSTISLDSSISSDEESTNCIGGSSTSTGSPGGCVKRVSFSPSPPQVREYERYDMEMAQPSSPQYGTSTEFSNLNKKRRTLKKNLDELNGYGVKSAVPVQGTQTVTRIAKQLGRTLLLVNAFVLTQRR